MPGRTEAAATGASGSASCPVCAEPLDGMPERCFRCETPLGRWWRFEEALRDRGGSVPAQPPPVEAVVPAAPGRRSSRPILVGLLGLVLAAAIMAAVASAMRSPREAPPPAAPASRLSAEAPAPAVIRYRVQPGDSLWRIAAAFTGDGARWRELWPEHAGTDGRITVGTTLEVRLPDGARR